MLNVLALPSLPADNLIETIDKMRPRERELSDFLLLKNEIRQCDGAIKIYEYEVTRHKVISILVKFAFVLVLIKSNTSSNIAGIISLIR